MDFFCDRAYSSFRFRIDSVVKKVSSVNAPISNKKIGRLGLEPGEMVELLIDYPARVRLKLMLIGFEVGKYVILKSPANQLRNEYSDVLVEGNTVVARYLIEGKKGVNCGFKASIRNLTKFPEHFLILNYPKHIHHKHLRKHQRIDVHLPVKITIDNALDGSDKVGLLGIIVDITPQGCALELDPDDIKTDLKDCYIHLALYHPQGHLIEISAFVRNTRVEKEYVGLGVSYIDDNEQIDDLLKHLLICTSR